MGAVSILALVCASFVAYVGGFHAWVYLLRRKEPAHIWLSLAAVGVSGIAVGTSLLYLQDTVEGGRSVQNFMFLCSAPLLLGFFRFSFCFLEIERPRLDRFVLVLSAIMLFVAGGTNWLFTGVPVERSIELLDLSYVESTISAVGYGFMAVYTALFVILIRVYYENVESTGENARLLFAMMCIWFGTALSDMLVAAEVYEAPLFIAFGYTAFLLGWSSILIRRMVRSMDEVERSARELHELVDARSEQLRQKDLQLAHGEKLATIGTLAAGIAHEINNPIAFVSTNLNQLEELWQKGEGGDEVPEILHECRDGVERVRSIVSELLSMARRSDGTDELVDLTSVVASTLPLVQRQARYSADLATALEPVPEILGDPRLLGQIVINLVLNAIQAIPEGRPQENRVTVSTSFSDGSVWLVVADTGPGIPPDILPRIFDPFFTTKAEGEGTGLGLAVTHQLVTRHRGRLDVQTGASGTTVTVELPPAPSRSERG